jgi:gluconate 2-dehydrogenase gamma chain
LSGSFPFPNAARAAAASKAPVSLTSAEWTTLEAMTARLIPTDHQPGAREAECVNFIDKALANEESAALSLYRQGLAALDRASQARAGKPFAQLTEPEQDAVLVAVATGPSAEFFETARVHTLIGFLADPKYGGNRDLAGWKVAGYPGPRHHQGGYSPEEVSGQAPIRMPWDEPSG